MLHLKTDKVVTIDAPSGGEKFDQTLALWDDMDMRLEVVGAAGCGKSALILRYYSGESVDYEPSVEESCREIVTLKLPGPRSPHHEVCVDILDTRAGDENTEKTMHGFLLCFDVCDRGSLEYLQSQVLRIQALLADNSPPMVLCGTKCDRADRMVPRTEADGWAQTLGIPYVETSAQLGTGVNEAISEVIRAVVRIYAARASAEPRNGYCWMM